MAIVGMLIGLLGMGAGLVSFVCFCIFLFKLFESKGAGHAVAGFFCGLYTLYFAFTSADQLDASQPPIMGVKYKNFFYLWVAAILGSMVLNGVASVVAGMAAS
jgi:hypothetical protein